MGDDRPRCDWCPNPAIFTISSATVAEPDKPKMALCRPCYYMWSEAGD